MIHLTVQQLSASLDGALTGPSLELVVRHLQFGPLEIQFHRQDAASSARANSQASFTPTKALR